MSHKLQKAPQSRPGYAPASTASHGPLSPRLNQGPPPSSRPYNSPRPRQASSHDSHAYSSESRGSSMVHGVASGQVGGGYGPYSGTHGQSSRSPVASSSSHKPERPRTTSKYYSYGTDTMDSHSSSQHAQARYNLSPHQTAMVWSSKDAELDDHIHNPSPHDALVDSRSFHPFSGRGWANMTALIFILGSLITFFAGYPIISQLTRPKASTNGAWGLGGINSTGQVPNIPNLPSLIDVDTPQSAMSRTGFDGQSYELVFSDEFNTDGRTFWPGDDPFWEAVDRDYEWYDPDAATTVGGALQITITEQPLHHLNFRSGMLQSWNKFCFTGGYIEVSISLPGISTVPGFWPGAWTLGNLARAGHGATTDGTWPFSYNACDVGTMKNQTNLDGATPTAAKTSGSRDYGGELSYQPGQRLSACTCPSSSKEHPGPNVNTGRGGPEIDILEAQVSYNAARGGRYGTVSQSAQFAPYDASYEAIQTAPQSVIHTPANTYYNDYLGGIYQQALSAVTATPPAAYTGGQGAFAPYGFEYWPDESNGYITWQTNGQQAWTLNSAAIGPNPLTQVSQRLVSEEPMSIILNLGLSASFQALRFPGRMLVDYVRVYQRSGSVNVGCDPKNRPTAQYIQNHLEAYTNPNCACCPHPDFRSG